MVVTRLHGRNYTDRGSMERAWLDMPVEKGAFQTVVFRWHGRSRFIHRVHGCFRCLHLHQKPTPHFRSLLTAASVVGSSVSITLVSIACFPYQMCHNSGRLGVEQDRVILYICIICLTSFRSHHVGFWYHICIVLFIFMCFSHCLYWLKTC